MKCADEARDKVLNEKGKTEMNKGIEAKNTKREKLEWYRANAKVMRVIVESVNGLALVERMLEFDREHLYCEYPKGSVLDFWGENAGKEFIVKSDEAYFGYITVYVKGEKKGFEECPYYMMGMEDEERAWLKGALNELSAIWRGLEARGERKGK